MKDSCEVSLCRHENRGAPICRPIGAQKAKPMQLVKWQRPVRSFKYMWAVLFKFVCPLWSSVLRCIECSVLLSDLGYRNVQQLLM